MHKNLIIKSDFFSSRYNCNIYFKPEWYGPTGSHKDKWAQTAIQLAQEAGAQKVVVMSSGNQGLALAASAHKTGMLCLVVAVEPLDSFYISEFKKYATEVVRTQTIEEQELAFNKYTGQGYFPLGITHAQREKGIDLPGINGYEISASEIINTLKNPPDILIFPSAYGDHPQGVLRGFQKLTEVGKTKKIPQCILARARYPEGDLATSIVTNHTTPYITHILKNTHGESVFVDNEEMLKAQRLIQETHGWEVEISSAATVAALEKLKPEIFENKSIVIILTALKKQNG